MEVNESFLQKFRNLVFVEHQIDRKKDTFLTSCFKGYVYADEVLENYIRQYLWEYHSINYERNTWVEQVDYYAFEKGLDWDTGFIRLVEAILETSYNLQKKLFIYMRVQKSFNLNISIISKNLFS